MAVPTPPTAGEPIAEAWGDVVHDAVVAMDIQSGKVQMTLAQNAAEIGVAVVFSRPFAAPPTVVVGTESAGGTAGRQTIGRKSAITETGFTAWLQNTSGGAAAAVTQTVDWLAYGPRA